MTDTTTTATFEVGATYECRFVTDADLRVYFEVVARTAKFVTIAQPGEAPKRRGVKVHDGVEYLLPFGEYSMAPVLSASRKVEA